MHTVEPRERGVGVLGSESGSAATNCCDPSLPAILSLKQSWQLQPDRIGAVRIRDGICQLFSSADSGMSPGTTQPVGVFSDHFPSHPTGSGVLPVGPIYPVHTPGGARTPVCWIWLTLVSLGPDTEPGSFVGPNKHSRSCPAPVGL